MYFVCVDVDGQIVDLQLFVGCLGSWLQVGVDVCDEFFWVEGFDYVVVGVDFEIFDYVGCVVVCCEYDDGYF